MKTSKLILFLCFLVAIKGISQTKSSSIPLSNRFSEQSADLISQSLRDVPNGVTFRKGYIKKSTQNKNSNEITTIPDANFEQALIDLGIDSDGTINQQILTSDAEAVLELDVANKNINDLTGIEAFVNLTLLYCWRNQLTSLDLSNNTKLESFSCAENQLSVLDVSQLTQLKVLGCRVNRLTNLDLSNNLLLEEIFCDSNQLTSLDVSSHTSLVELNCAYNQITSLDLSNSNNLYLFFCSFNKLTNLVLGPKPNLVFFNCNDNQLTSLTLQDANVLSQLFCYNNQLTGLDLSSCQNLANFYAYNNALTGLDTSLNSKLYSLYVWDNFINALDLSQNLDLELLSCGNNSISSLDVSNNLKIRELWCYQNQISTLDTSNNLELKYLVAWENNIPSFDVSQNNKLVAFEASLNPITSLDLSNNSLLEHVWCWETDLTDLNVANGNNTLIDYTGPTGTIQERIFRINRNPNLFCAKVDDIAWSNANWLEKDAHTGYSLDCSADDDNDGVINSNDKCSDTPAGETVDTDGCSDAQLNADDDGDGVINFDDLCPNTPIGNLVNSEGCSIVEIPDSNFEQALIDLGIDSDGTIDQKVFLSDIENITNLNVYNKNISDLTGIEGFKSLQSLYCHTNQISSIDLSWNTSLITLICDDNQFVELDLSNNLNLDYLSCGSSALENLNISQNIKLKFLDFRGSKITSIDVSDHIALEQFMSTGNNLTSIDLSNNPNLFRVYCHYSGLESLNIKNGNNQKISNADFYALNNSGLTCIQVDDAEWSADNWTNIDPGASFNEDCSDDDADGVINTEDFCPDTPEGETVDNNGCSESQKDDDNDGVFNNLDVCPDTPEGETVNIDGCSESQLDDDGDGIFNNTDNCPNTFNSGQEDFDNDGIGDVCDDDIDGDGVLNDADSCMNTPAGESVNVNGCASSELDDDGDGVINDNDLYPNTPAGETVDANGGVVINPSLLNISWKSPTCPDVNNAEISIQINKNYPMNVTVTGPGGYSTVSNNRVLTSPLVLTGLSFGEYQVSFSFTNDLGADFNGYILNIEEAPNVTGKSIKTNKKSKTVTFKVSGDTSYTIYVNDEYLREVTFLDADVHEIVIDKLFLGDNYVKIVPKNACRGIIQQWITIQGDIQFYPNPTQDFVFVRGLTSEEVTIQVFNTLRSQLFNERYRTDQGEVTFSLENVPSGVYIVKVIGNENDTVEFKVIKK